MHEQSGIKYITMLILGLVEFLPCFSKLFKFSKNYKVKESPCPVSLLGKDQPIIIVFVVECLIERGYSSTTQFIIDVEVLVFPNVVFNLTIKMVGVPFGYSV